MLIGCATKTIDDTGADLTDTAVSPDCLESAAGELPEDAVWITLDGQSSQLLSPADGELALLCFRLIWQSDADGGGGDAPTTLQIWPDP